MIRFLWRAFVLWLLTAAVCVAAVDKASAETPAAAASAKPIVYPVPVEILIFNGERLLAAKYEGETLNDLPHGLGSFRITGSKLFDEVRGDASNGRLNGLVTVYLSPGVPNVDYRPAMICDARLENCREAPPPRNAFFRGSVVDGKLTGLMTFHANGRYIGDFVVDGDKGNLVSANIYLYHVDGGNTSTRRFVGSISREWVLVGDWFDIPWSRTLADSYFISANGNNGVLWNTKNPQFIWSGQYGKAVELQKGIRLLVPHVHPAEIPKLPPSLSSSSFIDARYGATVSILGSRVSDDDLGRFHGFIDARTPDGIAYRAKYSPSKGQLIGPATIWSDGKKYTGATDGQTLTWQSEGKLERAIDRFARGAICPLGGKSAKDQNCNVDIALNVDSAKRVTLANNPGYVPKQTEYEAIKNANPEVLRRINDSFSAGSSTWPYSISNIGVGYMLQAKMYSALASQQYSGAASAQDFGRKAKEDIDVIASLANKTSLAPETLFAWGVIQNEKLVNQANVFRGPAGLIDALGNFFGFWRSIDASTKILDVKLRIDSYGGAGQTIEQQILIYQASRKVEKIGVNYLNNFAAQSAINLDASLYTAIFSKIPSLDNLSQRDQIKVLNDFRIKAEEFYDKNQTIKSAGDFAFAVAREIESRLIEDLKRRGAGLNIPPPM